MTIKLSAGDIVFNSDWTKWYLFKVGSVEAYAAKYNEDPAQRYQQCVEHGHDAAWANQISACIDNTGHSHREYLANAARAIALEAGQKVEIEGRVYVTKMVGKRYSDGIQFKAA